MKKMIGIVGLNPIRSHANFEEIMEQHKDNLTGVEGVQHFSTLSSKLSELGYDVLLNDKKKSEFIPAGRLNDVVAQRDQFKTQAEDFSKQLETMKAAAKGNEALQAQIQTLIDSNNGLVKQVEETKVNTAILLEAKDAHKSEALLPFVNKEKIKVDDKGNVTGVKEEIDRLRKEMPFLFGTTQNNKGGLDKGGKGGNEGFNMNTLIRRAAGQVISNE